MRRASGDAVELVGARCAEGHGDVAAARVQRTGESEERCCPVAAADEQRPRPMPALGRHRKREGRPSGPTMSTRSPATRWVSHRVPGPTGATTTSMVPAGPIAGDRKRPAQQQT